MADEKKSDNLTGVVANLVKDCEGYREQLAEDRKTADEYFDGRMSDVPAPANRSAVVSRDVRSTIKKVLPSLIRVILGGDKVAEYSPVGQNDEEFAEQATDYVSNIVFPESDGVQAVQDAIHDALKLRNGVLRWWQDKEHTVTITQHSGLDADALAQLLQDDDVTVLGQSSSTEQIQMPDGSLQETPVYDVKIRRRSSKSRPRVAAVPPENFLIHPDAKTIRESPCTGINEKMRRSDLIAMGYDRKVIDELPIAGNTGDQDDEESTRRRELIEERDTFAHAMQEVEYYELYVRVDADNDGIAELRRMVYAGAINEEYLLEDEEWDEVPFADIIVERRPHQREGTSVSDDTMEPQKVKTVLLRESLDNIYWQNKAQPIIQEEAVVNPDAVLRPSFGKPIRVNAGTSVNDAVGFARVPFVAQSSFEMMNYFDREIADVTGITDASSGLAPDALQNMTAKASAMFEAAGIGQTDLMARTVSHGLIPVFKGLLKLIIKHQDKPRTVRLRNKWVTFDPRPWNSEMDVTVNTGLGAGTRERDMMMMQMIASLQEKLLSSYGPMNNPFVTPRNVYNALSKLVEASGLRSVDQYFTLPSDEQIKGMEQAAANKPDPAMLKLQQEQAKFQADQALRMEELKSKERIEMAKLQQEDQLKRYQIDREIELKQRQNVAQVLTGGHVSTAQLGGFPG